MTTADVKHLRDGRRQVLDDTEFRISETGLAHSAARLHPAGTVVLSRTASVGFSAIMGQAMATSQDFVTWSPGSDLEPRYLYWVLRAIKSIGDLDRLMYGSTHKTIYVPDLQQLRGPMPPIEDQGRIADYLDAETTRIDHLIASHQRLVALARERHEARAFELFRQPEPGSTDQISLNVATERFVTGRTPPTDEAQYFGGDIEWVGPSDFGSSQQDLAIGRARRTISDTAVQEGRVQLVPTGAVALVCIGATTGRVGWVDRPLTTNQQITCLLPGAGMDGRFLAWQLWSMSELLRTTAGEATMPIVSTSQLRQLRVWQPDRGVQARVVEELDRSSLRLARLADTVQEEVRLLRERREALITAAVTGELEV